jgi:hypothetical protein
MSVRRVVNKSVGLAATLFVATSCGANATPGRTIRALGPGCGPPRFLRQILHDPVLLRLAGRPGRLLANRCGTFPLVLYRQGKEVIHGSCYVHALQYEHYPWIEYRVNRTRFSLPAGIWVLRESFREASGSGTGGPLVPTQRTLKAVATVVEQGSLGGAGGNALLARPRPRLMPHRIACGVFAGHQLSRTSPFHPTEKVFATITWPTFKLLGMNVPVDPQAADGGLNP